MSGRIGSCTFSTGCNQQINAVAKIENEDRCAVLGTVVNNGGRAIADAVVVLLKVNDRCSIPTPITHTFTDRYGQFAFGPLCPNSTYMLKIYKDDINVENINLICNCQVGSCLGRNNNNSNNYSNNYSIFYLYNYSSNYANNYSNNYTNNCCNSCSNRTREGYRKSEDNM